MDNATPPLRLDHIVIAVRDLAQAMADYTALGFTVLRGGEHAGRSSHNALVVFADGTYLELIAWRAPAPDERWYREHARCGDGLVDFALLPGDVGDVVRACAARGLALDGPLPGARRRPDGAQLQWQTARAPSHDLPFLCGDITPRALRVPEGDARVHANGVVGVAALSVAVDDLAASLVRYRALLGAGDVRPFALPGSGLQLAAVTLGETTLVLASPSSRNDTTPLARGIRERLAGRGPGPYAMSLRLAPGAPPPAFDTALTHGFVIDAITT